MNDRPQYRVVRGVADRDGERAAKAHAPLRTLCSDLAMRSPGPHAKKVANPMRPRFQGFDFFAKPERCLSDTSLPHVAVMQSDFNPLIKCRYRRLYGTNSHAIN